MKIVSATLSCVSLPFVEKFSHSLGARNRSESVFVTLRTAEGVVGHGEGMPRTYVTGEDFDSCMRVGREELWPQVVGIEIPTSPGADFTEILAFLHHRLPAEASTNAVRCAFELAVIDCWLRTAGRSLGAELPPVKPEVLYSAVIPTGTLTSTDSHARQWKLLGVDQVKIKIDGTEDHARVKTVRDVFGAQASLRVDGNAAYDAESALRCLEELAPLGVVSAEQMLPRGDLEGMVSLRPRSPVPLMVDESLISLEDARVHIERKACDLFNVRISKCGGLGPSLAIVALAREAGVGFQLGCHVGESALLSAVGRHFAAHVDDARGVEGSFGTLLLKEDVSRESVRFGHRGRARVMEGPGFGVEVQEDVLVRHAVRQVVLGGGPG